MPQYRKHLRLANFDYGQAGTYFITVCVKDGKCILGTIHPNVGADVHISRDKEKYREIWRYIDENPLRWELDRYYEESLDKPIPS